MEIQDFGASARISELTELLRRVSLATEPWEIQREFGQSMRERTGAEGYISLSLRDLPHEQPQPYRITRFQVEGEVGLPTKAPWTNPKELPIGRGGFLGRLIETPTPKLVHHLDVRDDPVLGEKLAPFKSCIATPLYDRGEALNWGITLRRDPMMGDVSEVDEFMLRGNLIGGLTRALLRTKEANALNERLTQQMEQIAQIQRSLLPEELPRIPGLDIAASYLTSNEAGGDYYDFFEMGDDRWGFVIADVSGHGAGAATVMAMLQAILHGFQERTKGPVAMLDHANRQLLVRRVESNFVTAFFGVVDPERRTIEYANAGHNRPLHRRADGSMGLVDGTAAMPLGILDEPMYEKGVHAVDAGETIVLYTDGITEAFSPMPAREMFGTQRLIEALEHCSGEPDCVIGSIHERLFEHTGLRTREDDQTIVVIRVEE